MSTSAPVKFSIGDYITDFENIYKIYDKKTEEDYHHQSCLYFLYRPVDATQKNSASFSIPANNIQKSGLRHLIKEVDIKEFYKILKKPLDRSVPFDFKSIKETLYLNDPQKTINVLQQLAANKADTGEKFSKNYQEMITNITYHLSAEIAFVTKKSIESVEKEIQKLLK